MITFGDAKNGRKFEIMVGRRQLREKVMQAVYAWKSQQPEAETRKIENNMLRGIDRIYDLYVYLLNLLRFQKSLAESKIELAKNKHLPTEKDLNPNLRFVENPIFRILDHNKELNDFLSKNSQLEWDTVENSCAAEIFRTIINGPEYEAYMSAAETSFAQDKEFIIDLYEKYIACSDCIFELMEEKELYWPDDLHIGNSMVKETLKSFVPHKDPAVLKLFRVYRDGEDRDFVIRLFRETIKHNRETLEIIENMADNWELERIASLDLILLQMALTEFLYFPNIPPKVIMDEYIEMSKVYSTDRSNIFVNGVLDRSFREIKRI